MKSRKTNLDPIKRNIRANTLNGAYAAINQNMVANFLGVYARDLGASSFQFGLLTALPALVTAIFTLPGLPLVEKQRNKAMQSAVLALGSRFFYLLYAMASFFAPSVWLLLIFVGLTALPNSWATLSWTALIGEAIPEGKRAMAFSQRNRLISICGLVATMGAGQLMEWLVFPWSYRLVFLLAFLFALIEIFYLLALRQTEPAEKVQMPMRWRELSGLKEYRSFLTGSLLFQVGFQFALPLFTIYTLRDLGASPFWVSLIAVSSSIAQIFTYPIWARWNDRHGWIKAMIWSIAIMSANPVLYAVTTTLWPLLLLNLVAGFGWAGYNLVSFNALLQACPSGAREGGIAYYNVLMNGIAAVLPLIAVFVSDWIGIRWALGIGSALRMLGVAYFYFSIRSHFPIRLRTRSDH